MVLMKCISIIVVLFSFVTSLINFIIQVVSNLTATMAPLFYMEAWGRFPKERDRLFKLITESKVTLHKMMFFTKRMLIFELTVDLLFLFFTFCREVVYFSSAEMFILEKFLDMTVVPTTHYMTLLLVGLPKQWRRLCRVHFIL